MRLIDADVLIEQMDAEPEGGYYSPHDVISLLMTQPTIEERKRGMWMPHNEKRREYIGTVLVNVTYDYWFCDTCGYRVENGQPMYNFCPNCGARMGR